MTVITAYAWTPEEWERLWAYREAVRAKFFTDWPAEEDAGKPVDQESETVLQ